MGKGEYEFDHLPINKSNKVGTTDAFWRTVRVLVIESEIQLVCDGLTDGPTDGNTLL